MFRHCQHPIRAPKMPVGGAILLCMNRVKYGSIQCAANVGGAAAAAAAADAKNGTYPIKKCPAAMDTISTSLYSRCFFARSGQVKEAAVLDNPQDIFFRNVKVPYCAFSTSFCREFQALNPETLNKKHSLNPKSLALDQVTNGPLALWRHLHFADPLPGQANVDP